MENYEEFGANPKTKFLSYQDLGKQMITTNEIIKECVQNLKSRIELWVRFIEKAKIETMAEIGVYRGNFAKQILKNCESLKKYYMIDPWRHLEDWNKPANVDNNLFEQYFNETKLKTDFASNKRVILRGKTMEVISEIPEKSLDFIYIDSDHTLRGITIDLINTYSKIRNGGWIGGDDFSQTIWQHSISFEPTLVFPYAVYFAEAVNAQIYALPFDQFLIEKTENLPFAFIDLIGRYSNLSLRDQLCQTKIVKLKLKKVLSSLGKLKKRFGNF